MNQKKILRNGEEVLIRSCTMDDLHALLYLQDEVIASLTTVSFLQPLSTEEFTSILTGNGRMIGAFSGNELIAFRALLIPPVDEPEHLAADAGLAEAVWSQVIYSEVSNVKPSFRGNGLQKILGKLLIEEIDTKQFRYIFATVAPFNIASLVDKFAHGLQIVALKEKYGGNLRYVLQRDFKAQVKQSDMCEFVPMENREEQQVLLAKGWRGVAVEQQGEQWVVQYCQYD